MLPKDFPIRVNFIGGEQSKVTPLVKEISNMFAEENFPEGFKEIHDYLFERLELVPYGEEIKEAERVRRWKLTANELLEVGTIIDTKYCNDVVNLFLAVTKGMGFEANLAKVFNRGEGGDIRVHSLALIELPNQDKKFLINAGSKDNYWIEELTKETNLIYGTELPHNWIVWKKDVDQWAMGLIDSAQEESTIKKEAKTYFESK